MEHGHGHGSRVPSGPGRQPLLEVSHIANRVPIPPEVQALRDPRTRGQYIHPDLKTKYVPGPHNKFVRRGNKRSENENDSPEKRGSEDVKRLSYFSAAAASTTSSASPRPKDNIGPWDLGKRLGAGSTAVVRLCRHRGTHELGAVKIVPRHLATQQQAGSLGNLEKLGDMHDEKKKKDGQLYMPLALEREVAILKLIEHPNIMKLLDIWENRAEIYIVTEYVEKGDLFGVINERGALPEEEAVHYFRQMMRALEYCHSFNICHRDLKPENILLKRDGTVKIADFSMAALHQKPGGPLHTACGSPHYAAPELLRHQYYKGAAADIWSLGVILYAMLSASLPFDDPDMEEMLARARRADYTIPACIGNQAKDLIRRMLVIHPNHRITMKMMWRHALIRRYDYLDELLPEAPRDLMRDVVVAPIAEADVDSRVLRQLRSMWHSSSEKELLKQLASDRPNDQKLFYKLIADYRQKQLENYNAAGIPISNTDVHHMRCGSGRGQWKRHISTCDFTEPARNGQARAVSRFSVISTVQRRTTNETVRSYDPYNASRKLRTSESQVSHARITVHRNGTVKEDPAISHSYHSYRSVAKGRMNTNSQRTTASGGSGSVVSLPAGRAMHAASRHKRGVDFSNVRKAPSSVAGRSRRGSVSSSTHQTTAVAADPPPPVPPIFTEELRKFSSGIAKDCDEAFGSSLLLPESATENDAAALRGESPFSLSLGPSPAQRRTASMQVAGNLWDSRPLPPPPAEDTSTPPRHVAAVAAAAVAAAAAAERRAVSTPVYNQFGKSSKKQLPSIWEGNTPAPPHSDNDNDNAKDLDYLARADRTIWMVNSPTDARSDLSSVKAPAPLHVTKSKRVSHAPVEGLKLKQEDRRQSNSQAPHDSKSPDWQTVSQSSDGTVQQRHAKKKSTIWFRRSSKEGAADTSGASLAPSGGTASASPSPAGDPQRWSSQSTSAGPPPVPPVAKKRPFSLSFWKNAKPEFRLSLAGPDYQEAGAPESDVMHQHQHQRRASPSPDVAVTTITPTTPAWDEGGADATGGRRISVHQNWLARLLRIKPATRHLCFAISRRRARQEVAILLREWRRYGIRDVQVDKERNVVFARVGARNYLQLKEVEFAIEIMTVIEHGKRNHLAIARFTQERGAASSFHRVVDTMSDVFLSRGLLVPEKKKTKMMIKTLNAA